MALSGGRGYDGPPGPPGKRGRTGTQGEQGPRGAEGPEGPKGRTGRTGKRGPRGTQGPQGDQGPAGPPGNTGPRGHPGPRGRMGKSGPEGVAGKPGHTGKPGAVGIQGPRGPRGPQGHRGRPGPRGYDGSLKKYHLDGPNRFMLTGGSGDALSAKIFTGQENKAPVLYLESQDAPVSIQMYQSRKRSHVAGIFGYYGNVGIGVSKPKAKLHVQGQIMMSHNFNNVLVSREKRRVGSSLQEYQFDLIGTYWGMDRSAVYIGGFTGPEKPYHHAEKVVFGGSSQNKDGKASIDLLKGTVSATAFLTQQLVQHDENEMDELEAEMLLDMSSNTNEMSRHIDLGRSSHYLHRTVKSQAKMIADLQSQLSELTRKFKQLQQRVRDE